MVSWWKWLFSGIVPVSDQFSMSLHSDHHLMLVNKQWMSTQHASHFLHFLQHRWSSSCDLLLDTILYLQAMMTFSFCFDLTNIVLTPAVLIIEVLTSEVAFGLPDQYEVNTLVVVNLFIDMMWWVLNWGIWQNMMMMAPVSWLQLSITLVAPRYQWLPLNCDFYARFFICNITTLLSAGPVDIVGDDEDDVFNANDLFVVSSQHLRKLEAFQQPLIMRIIVADELCFDIALWNLFRLLQIIWQIIANMWQIWRTWALKYKVCMPQPTEVGVSWEESVSWSISLSELFHLHFSWWWRVLIYQMSSCSLFYTLWCNMDCEYNWIMIYILLCFTPATDKL